MPELPEVETVKNGLIKKVKGRKILKCKVLWDGIIAYPDKQEFIKEITNQTINDITRRGKFLMFILDDYYLISHLRMEGKYFIKESTEELNKHDHVIFSLDNSKELRYNDTRKFGKMYLVKFNELDKSPISKLGKEPWDEDLTKEYLKEKLNKKKAIKTLLLDQSIITGIGNIYADEILFLSHIHPETYGANLTDKNLKRTGIHQIYKDKDNEELRYSIRSILEYIPWIRKIFILMPNDKVKFLKSVDEIKEKIIFIKDKDILGFESANNPSFLFNLFKMEKFGLSKNFIYMDDDYFIGKPLFKTDFFYFNEKEKKVVPYIISTKFLVINKTFILGRYNELFNKKEFLQPHSSKAFWLQIYCGEKYFIEHYNFSLIYTEFTHNAIAENVDELKEIYEEAKKYEYFNETLFSKERFI